MPCGLPGGEEHPRHLQGMKRISLPRGRGRCDLELGLVSVSEVRCRNAAKIKTRTSDTIEPTKHTAVSHQRRAPHIPSARSRHQ
jgi:hypothetical protein